MRTIFKLAAAVAILAVTPLSAAASHTVVVCPANMDGWTLATGVRMGEGGPLGNNTASARIVNGPATPPMGTGSVLLAVGTNGDAGAEAQNTTYNGTRLDALTQLTYSTYWDEGGAGTGQTPYIMIVIQNDTDPAADDILVFEPVYQTGGYPTVTAGTTIQPQNGGVVVRDQWQTWDARNGGWWTHASGTGGPPLITLNQYMAANPNATIAGLVVAAGYGAGAWDNFVGNSYAVIVGAAGHTTTFNFETTCPAAPASPAAPAASAPAASAAPQASGLPNTAGTPAGTGDGGQSLIVTLAVVALLSSGVGFLVPVMTRRARRDS